VVMNEVNSSIRRLTCPDPLSATETDAGSLPDRDDFEIGMVRHALAAGIPVLAICRGMQVLNVALGGTLVQDLTKAHGSNIHRRGLGTFDEAEKSRLARGRLARRTGCRRRRARRTLPPPPGDREAWRGATHHRASRRGRAPGDDRNDGRPLGARRSVAPGGAGRERNPCRVRRRRPGAGRQKSSRYSERSQSVTWSAKRWSSWRRMTV